MSAFLNELIAAELDLYKTVTAVTQVDNGVTLQALFGAKMVYASVQRLRLDTQIADTKRLKKQSTGF